MTALELDSIMATIKTPDQLEKVDYANCTTQTKVVLLLKATHYINNATWRGCTVENSQVGAFPRLIDGERVEGGELLSYAIAEIVYALLANKDNSRIEMQEQGVQSASIGGIAETYKVKGLKGRVGREWEEWVQNWLVGGWI